MGEMAELAEMEYYEWLAEQDAKERMSYRTRTPLYKTEKVLNSTKWTDGNGEIHELENMEDDHLKNVLHFLYKKRDKYWLNCQDVNMSMRFKDGDEFFQRVIRQSTIWNAIVHELSKSREQGFNFEIKGEVE